MDNNPWNDFESVLERARDAQQKGDSELAYEFYARASELNPNGPEGWRGRAATSPSPDDALISLAYTSALEPAGTEMGQALEQRIASRCATARPGDAPTLVEVGNRLAEVGLTRQAQRMFRQATALDPTLESGLVWLAGTTDDAAEAARLLEQVASQNPGNATAQAGLLAVRQQLNQGAAAAGSLPSQNRPPLNDPAEGLIHEGEQALVEGDRARAHELFTRATEVSPHNENGWTARARASDDLEEALTCLEQALAINPNNVDAREARTFYRVRKLRDGMKKGSEPPPDSGPAPDAPVSEETGDESHGRRVFMLVVLILILIAMLVLAYARITA